jgi:hypothetical protein
MSKFILIADNNRVSHVESSRPEDALPWIEVDNDLVQPNWWRDPNTLTLYEYRPYTIEEVREKRNYFLNKTDWMVLPDSPYQAADQSSNLQAIKDWRQSLRDFPDPNASYDENNLNIPLFPL